MSIFAPHPILAHFFSGSFGVQTNDPAEWAAVAISLGLLVGQLAIFARVGRRSEPIPAAGRGHAIGAGIARVTGLPAWSGAGIVVGLWALTTAFVGFVWDVAWHMDLGRDRELFTVPHTLILVGLIGLGVAALVSIAYATRARAAVGWHVRKLVIPSGAAVLLALSAAALVAFPLDDLWHATYGIDVTMWSPTHLLMIAGASLAPLAMALLLWEARGAPTRSRRFLQVLLLGTVLVGLSTFQLEFDMGVPQWQAVYQPVLIALATAFSLTVARALLGPWGAVRVVLTFLAMRGVIALLVGPLLGHSLPHFPLYIVEALCVEVAFALTAGTLRRAMTSGLLIGTAGMGSEWLWMQLWGLQPWRPGMLALMWVAAVAAVAAALAGMGLAARLGSADARIAAPPRWVMLGGVAAIVVALAIPFPRQGSSATVRVSSWPVSRAVTAVDRSGRLVTTHDIAVTVQVSPQSAADGADWFRVSAWQGGGVVNAPLVSEGSGSYVASRSIPVGGNWKAIVMLAKGSTVAAAPIAMPAEPDQGLSAIPLVASRTAALQNAQLLLLRENHAGAAWVADLAYAVFAATVLGWVIVLSAAAARVTRTVRGTGSATSRRASHRLHLASLRTLRRRTSS